MAWEHPRTRRQLQSFLGFANFYCQFIHQFAEIAVPLTELLKTKGQGETRKVKSPGSILQLTDACQAAFDKLKQMFVAEPIPQHPDPECPFIFQVDASDASVGGILLQKDPQGGLRPFACQKSFDQALEGEAICQANKV